MSQLYSRHGTVSLQRLAFRALVFPTAILATILLTPSLVQADWSSAWGPGNVPINAVRTGSDLNNVPLYSCRASHNGSKTPGKIQSGWNSCDIGYGGQEVWKTPYEMLVPGWSSVMSNGQIPGNAYGFGYDSPASGDKVGRPLYPCRATIDGTMQLGKIGYGFSGCNIPYGGREQTVSTNYQVLTIGFPVQVMAQSSLTYDALIGGTDSGTPAPALYLCQASYSGGLHPGKTRLDWSFCDIGYGGAEQHVSTFRVLSPYYPLDPVIPFVAGSNSDGSPLGICNVVYSSTRQPGKYLINNHVCNFGYGGTEKSLLPSAVVAYPSCGKAKRASDQSANPIKVDYVLAYESSFARWCVDPFIWADPVKQAAISQFFTYGDMAIARLVNVFQDNTGSKFTFELNDGTGHGGNTGTDFPGTRGDTVTYDVFTDTTFTNPMTGQVVNGFWGYVFPLHEAVNVYLGSVTGGWPNDWGSDHRSPLPNSLDHPILEDIGNQMNNADIRATAQAQHDRFYATSTPEGPDEEVEIFDRIYDEHGGYAAYQNTFKLIKGDGLKWDQVGANPSEVRSEYVIAYFQLGMKTTTDLTDTLFLHDIWGNFTGVGSAVYYRECNNVTHVCTDKWTTPYSVSKDTIRAIANAHCSIAAAKGAGKPYSTYLANLRKGAFMSAFAPGGTQAGCAKSPECKWDASSRCSVLW